MLCSRAAFRKMQRLAWLASLGRRFRSRTGRQSPPAFFPLLSAVTIRPAPLAADAGAHRRVALREQYFLR